MKLYFIAFIIGGIVGVAYDLIHVSFGVLFYRHPHILNQSLWVFPIFGGGAVLSLLCLDPRLARQKGPRSSSFPWPRRGDDFSHLSKPTLVKISYDAFLLAMAHLVDGIFVGRNHLTFIGLFILSFISIMSTKREKLEKIGYLAFPIIGPLGEFFLIQSGFFKYTYGFPIPYWLPLLWFVAAPLFMNAISYLIRKSERR